jgi:transposase
VHFFIEYARFYVTLKKMKKEISKDMRDRITYAYEEGKSYAEIGKLFGCHRKTMKRIVVAYIDEERVEAKPRGGSRPRCLSSQHEDAIYDHISDDCSISLESIQAKLIEKFKVNVSISTIFCAIRRFSFSLKRASRIPARRDDEDLVEKRHFYAIYFFSFLSQKMGKTFSSSMKLASVSP